MHRFANNQYRPITVMLSLGLKTKFFGLGLGPAVFGLGLELCGLV